MIEKVEGIVLNVRSYGETSKILNVLTKEHGIIGLMAKGAKGMKSELRSVTDKLIYGYFHIYYRENKLSNLTSVDIKKPFKQIKKDISKISYASFLLELTEQVYKQNGDDKIYDLLIAALVKIEEGYDPMIITNILELKYLYFLGVMPVIDACSICGSKVSIATLSSVKGGYVCRNCLKNEKIVSSNTIKLIRMFYYVELSKISKLDIKDISKREIGQFLDEYYGEYTGLYLKSKEFLKNISKVVMN